MLPLVACRVQVVYELLKYFPEGPNVPDDEGHTPLMIAADQAYEQPSEARRLVMCFMQQPYDPMMLPGAGSLARRPQPQATGGTSPAVVLCMAL